MPADTPSPIIIGDPPTPAAPIQLSSALPASSSNIGSQLLPRDDTILTKENAGAHLGTEHRQAKLRTSSRATPPLKLAIPDLPSFENARWQDPSNGEDAQVGVALCEGVGSGSATRDQAAFAFGNTGVGAGYFSVSCSILICVIS